MKRIFSSSVYLAVSKQQICMVRSISCRAHWRVGWHVALVAELSSDPAIPRSPRSDYVREKGHFLYISECMDDHASYGVRFGRLV